MAKSYRNLITSEKPSSAWGVSWREGYVSGNGRTGANVKGGAARERILLNSATLCWHGRTNVLPDVSLKMKEIKKAADDGDYLTLQRVLPSALAAKNYRPRPSEPLPLCVLKIDTVIEKGVKEYKRSLDMESGEVSVTFADGGSRYTRNLFVSWERDVVVMEIKKTGNKNIEADFGLALPEPSVTDNKCVMLPDGAQTICDKNFLCFAARNDSGLDYGAVVKIMPTGGTVVPGDKTVKVRGASSVLLLACLFDNSQRDREWKKAKDALGDIKDGYDKLKKAHTPLISKQMNWSVLQCGDDADVRAEDLLRSVCHDDVPAALAGKLRTYARYLFLSGGRNNLFTPVGLWNGEYAARGGIVRNGDLFEAYAWALDACRPENCLPLFDYLDERVGAFKDNAMRLFGKHGIFVPNVCSPATGRPGTTEPQNLYDVSLAAKAACLYYMYYLRTGDRKFLSDRALPFMKGAALFYEEFLVKESDGKLHTPFSCVFDGATPPRSDRPVVGKDAAGDIAAIRRLARYLAEACDDAKEKNKWSAMADALPAVEAGDDGTIKPYAQNKFNNENAVGLKMFYPVESGDVNRNSPQDEVKAYVNTLKEQLYAKRGEQNCRSMAGLAKMFAAFGERDAAKECVKSAVRGCVAENLAAVNVDWRGMGYLADSPDAYIDLYGNVALAAAVDESFVCSAGDKIYIMPCNPYPDADISADNIRADGCCVSLAYSAKGQSLKVTVKSDIQRTVTVALPAGVKKNVRTNRGVYDQNCGNVGVTLRKGEFCEITCKFTPSVK